MMNGTELNKLIPQIRRARDYHLYDFNGRRYLDFNLDGGRALLGHKPGRTVLMMKNALEKGLLAPYPGVYGKRLLKQLRMLYPGIAGCSVVYSGRKSKPSDGTALNIYRPFEQINPPEGELFILLLPLPGSGCFSLVCAPKTALRQLPESDPVPQYILSGMCRAAADLGAFYREADIKIWENFNSPLWNRNGPWLYPEVPADRYPALFSAFLDRGILLSADYSVPSCAPYLFNKGEIKPIKDIEKEFC